MAPFTRNSRPEARRVTSPLNERCSRFARGGRGSACPGSGTVRHLIDGALRTLADLAIASIGRDPLGRPRRCRAVAAASGRLDDDAIARVQHGHDFGWDNLLAAPD